MDLNVRGVATTNFFSLGPALYTNAKSASSKPQSQQAPFLARHVQD